MQAMESYNRRMANARGRTFKPVTHRTGFCGLFGKKELSKQWLQERISETEKAIDQERQEVFQNGVARSYFVLFETQVCIHVFCWLPEPC
jgi:hypothetical protein